MDSTSDPEVKGTLALLCSQGGGKTEIALNVIGYHVDHDPAPILYMAETLDKAKAFSTDRLAPMIRDTPVLTPRIQSPRSRDSGNTQLHKSFAGGQITMVGSNSAAGLSMRPKRVLICDELAGYELSAGTEGDPSKLAETRTVRFWNRVLLWITSPRSEGGRDQDLWNQSDQRRWFAPCGDCGHAQTLQWARVHWDKDASGEADPSTARYVCDRCGSLWTDVQRFRSLRRGEWRPTAPFRGIRGYHLPAMACLSHRLADLVEGWVEAQRAKERGNPELLHVFINTVLAEWWQEDGEAIDEHELAKRRTDWHLPKGVQVPERVVALTLGCDWQGDRGEYEVVGWAPDMENWSIAYGVIPGFLKQDAKVLEDLDRVLLQPWRHASGADLYIRAAGIDTGHGSQILYRFCDRRLRRMLPDGRSQFIFGLKGDGGPKKAAWPPAPSSRNRKSRRRLPGKNLWVIGSNAIKDHVAALLAVPKPGPGYCHVPSDRPIWWFEQVTSEHRVRKYRYGRPYHAWVPRSPGRRTEGWDCRCYAYAALVGVQEAPFLLDLSQEARHLVAAPRSSPTSGSGGAAPRGSTRRRGRRSKGVEL